MMDLIWSEELEPIIQILQQRADVTADEAGEIFLPYLFLLTDTPACLQIMK